MKKILHRISSYIQYSFELLIPHPARFFKVVFSKIRRTPTVPVKKKIRGIIFEFDYPQDPMVADMYHGVYEMDSIYFMKKYLKRGDVFIDVGANIGYLTAVAASLVGKTGQVHSFEPVPKYFRKLSDFANFNSEYSIVVNRTALGEKQGVALINLINVPNLGMNTIVPGLWKEFSIKEQIEISIESLDDYIDKNGIKKISLIKIDTEGYEFPVLKGLKKFFTNSEYLPPIMCEIFPRSYPILGFSLAELVDYMQKYGYRAFDPVCLNREVDITKLGGDANNVIFFSRKN